jgi:hypothetical protein
MFKYGSTQSRRTPSPEIDIEVSSPLDPRRRASIVCVVDTGACVSVMPLKSIRLLGPLDYTSCRIEWGSGIAPNYLYKVNIHVGTTAFTEHWVVATGKPYGLIGRDLLNSHLLRCDGPGQQWNVEPSWT